MLYDAVDGGLYDAAFVLYEAGFEGTGALYDAGFPPLYVSQYIGLYEVTDGGFDDAQFDGFVVAQGYVVGLADAQVPGDTGAYDRHDTGLY